METFEKETATFFLELSHPGVPGVWTRDGIRVKPSSRCRITAMGCGHSLTLEGLTLEDSGTVTFTTDTLRCTARLLVLGTVSRAGSGGQVTLEMTSSSGGRWQDGWVTPGTC